MAASTLRPRITSSSNQLSLAPSSTTYCRLIRKVAIIDRPNQSKLLARSLSPRSKLPKRQTSARLSRPGSTLMKNSHRQLRSSVRCPPSVGPTVGARVTIMPVTTLAVIRRSGGKAVKAMA